MRIDPKPKTPASSLHEAVTRAIERAGWADVPPLPASPPPLPREAQPYHPVTRPPTFRQGGYNR